MMYKIISSFDKTELNKILTMTKSFSMGDTIKLTDGRKYKYLDVECEIITDGDEKRFKIMGLLERIG